MNNRAAYFRPFFDFSSAGKGLEIGPLAQPVVTPSSGDISYVDLAPRETLADFYAGDPHVDVDAIPDIDYWITTPDGGQRTLAEAVGGASFDYVVASHVIEHVPDVIGWLAEVAEVTADEGALVLAVPDRRFSFDAARPATTVGQALAAHEAGDRIPSVRAVYDQNRSHVDYDVEAAWRGEPHGSRVVPFDHVIKKTDEARAGAYVDTHVWVLTPGEFLDLLDDLGRLGLVDFVVETVVPTPKPRLEFYAVLRRQRRGISTAEAAHEREKALVAARAAIPDESHSIAHQQLIRKQERTAEALRHNRDRVGRLRRRVDRQQRRIQRLEAELAAATSHEGPQRRLWRLFLRRGGH